MLRATTFLFAIALVACGGTTTGSPDTSNDTGGDTTMQDAASDIANDLADAPADTTTCPATCSSNAECSVCPHTGVGWCCSGGTCQQMELCTVGTDGGDVARDTPVSDGPANDAPMCGAGQCVVGASVCPGGNVCCPSVGNPNCGTCQPTCGSTDAGTDGGPDSGGGACGAGGACTPGLTCCAGGCKNFNNDPLNCGTCGHVCPAAMPMCNGGSCSVSTCSPACTAGQVCCIVPRGALGPPMCYTGPTCPVGCPLCV